MTYRPDVATTGQVAVKADKAELPQPATIMPPAVADASVQGGGVKYAREDHTHASSLQARRVQITLNAQGVGSWTYPTAYASGIVPVIHVDAETPSGSAYTNLSSPVEGTATNTSVQIRVIRLTQNVTLGSSLAALLSAVVNLFSPVTTNCWVNISVRRPTV